MSIGFHQDNILHSVVIFLSYQFEISTHFIFSDFHIKVVTLDTSKQRVFLGHEAPILCVVPQPGEKFLVSYITFLSVFWIVFIIF